MLLQVCAVIGDEIDLNLLSDVVPANMDRETLRLEMQYVVQSVTLVTLRKLLTAARHLEAAQFLTAVNSASDSSTPTSNSSATVSSQSGSNLIGHDQSSVASAAIEEISAYKFNSSVLREVAYKSASLRMRQTLHQVQKKKKKKNFKCCCLVLFLKCFSFLLLRKLPSGMKVRADYVPTTRCIFIRYTN